MGILDKLMVFAAGKDAKKDIPLPQSGPVKKKVLVVESDVQLLGQYAQLLQDAQFDVETAINGAEGLNTLLTFRPDLILLDMDLPIMDGKSMLHHMRAIPEYKNTPVVAVADIGDVDTIKQVKMYDGAKAFLIKSNVTPAQTVEAILNIL